MTHAIGTASCLLFIGLCLTSPVAQARVWTVNNTVGAADFHDYSDALFNPQLAAGDTIQFTDAAPVVYDETAAILYWDPNGGSSGPGVPDNITVTALHPGKVTLKGKQRMDYWSDAWHRTCAFSNLSFTGGTDSTFYLNVVTATFTACTFDDAGGGEWAHMLWSSAGLTTAVNCTFKNMTGTQSSPVIADWGAAVRLTNCTFDNIQGPCFRSGASSGMLLALDGCTVKNSVNLSGAYTALFNFYSGQISATHCDLAVAGGALLGLNPRSGADQPVWSITARFDGCKLHATTGPLVSSAADVILDAKFANCIFDGGSVQLQAGSAAANRSRMEADHCLFLRAASAVAAGGGADDLVIQNSILDASNAAGLQTSGAMTVLGDYNLVNCPSPVLGAHSLDGRAAPIDPKFVNAAAGDYHLTPASPCVGKGLLTRTRDDWDGDPRPMPANAASCDIGIDEIGTFPAFSRETRFYQPQSRAAFPDFNTRVGADGFRSDYSLPPPATELEQEAQIELALGSDVFKFALDKGQYYDMPDPGNVYSLVDTIQKMPAFQTVLDMPFKYTAMWCYSIVKLDGGGTYIVTFWDGLTDSEKQVEYQQIYDLTRFLLQRYQGTGRSFLIGHWEGDWHLLQSYDTSLTPTPTAIQGMIDWYKIRQQAVEDARASLPECKNVFVYHYGEVNIVTKSINHPNDPVYDTVTTAVLPHVTLDLISFSSYDALSGNYQQLPERVSNYLDFIAEHAHLSGVWPFERGVIIGEYGYGRGGLNIDAVEQDRRNTLGLRAAAAWGCPLILYWAIYGAPGAEDLVLVDQNNNQTPTYFTLQRLLAQTLALRDANRILLGRNPSEAEQNVLMDAFQTKTVASMLEDVDNGAEFAALGDSAAFLTALFQQALVPTGGSGAALYSSLLAGLNAGTTTRWQTQLDLIDSAEARAAVPDADFVHALYRATLARPESAIAPSDLATAAAQLTAGTKRSALWQQFLNGTEFGLTGLSRRNTNLVSDQLYRRFVLDFRASQNAVKTWMYY